jgi:protein-disulfide isomerase
MIFDPSLFFIQKNDPVQGVNKEITEGSSDLKSGSDPLITPNPDYDHNDIREPKINNFNPQKGSGDVVIIEYGDHLCGPCQDQEKVIEEIFRDHGDRVRFVWKDFPKKDKNSASWQSAVAARCAEEQDRFWDYHKALFAKKSIDDSVLINLAESMDLDIKKFESCLNSEKIEKLILKDMKEASEIGIYGVPTLFINGMEFRGKVSKEEIEQIIKNK